MEEKAKKIRLSPTRIERMTAWNYHIWNQALWELVMSCFLPGEAVTYRATAAPRAHQLEKMIPNGSKNGHRL